MKLIEIINCISEILSARKDVYDLIIPKDEDYPHFYYEGGPIMLDDQCIFDDCSIEIKKSLLDFYFSPRIHNVSFNWDVNIEFAKLAAKYGHFVQGKAKSFFPKNIIDEWERYFLHMAYFGSSIEYEDILIKLINCSPEDGRDGLFIAAWFLDTPRVYESLVRNCLRWHKDNNLDAGTGEIQAMRLFCQKWNISHCEERLHDALIPILFNKEI